MTIQGTVRDGVIIPDTGIVLPEGQTVEIRWPDSGAAGLDLPGFGIWRDREDMTDSAQAALDIRRRMERREL